jgi:hypothetical protein
VDPEEEGMENLGIGICAGASFDRLRQTIDLLARSPEKRRAMADRAFAFAQANHSLSHGTHLVDLMLNAACEAERARTATQ